MAGFGFDSTFMLTGFAALVSVGVEAPPHAARMTDVIAHILIKISLRILNSLL
jgi:hypothetical protein